MIRLPIGKITQRGLDTMGRATRGPRPRRRRRRSPMRPRLLPPKRKVTNWLSLVSSQNFFRYHKLTEQRLLFIILGRRFIFFSSRHPTSKGLPIRAIIAMWISCQIPSLDQSLLYTTYPSSFSMVLSSQPTYIFILLPCHSSQQYLIMVPNKSRYKNQ